MSGYAVVDLETTGIHPGRHERIVEVAVVHVSPRGVITGTWETLVNPQRDLGPQRIHGIRAAEIVHAPTFEQIADELAALLRGRVVVAHNLRFDAGFLTAEYLRCGYQIPIAVEHGLCTMDRLTVTYRARGEAWPTVVPPSASRSRMHIEPVPTRSPLRSC